jgi:DNA polymerase III alpha subunit (gram-positive type)
MLQRFKDYITEGQLEKGVKSVDDLIKKLSGKTWIVFDTETTGLSPKKDYVMVTEVAAVAIDSNTGKEIGRYHKKANLSKEVHDRIELEKQKAIKFKARAPFRKGQDYTLGDIVEHDGVWYSLKQQHTRKTPAKDDDVWKKINIKQLEKLKSIKDLMDMTAYSEENAEFTEHIDMLKGFKKWIDGYNNRIIVAHNARFDMYQVNSPLAKIGQQYRITGEVVDSLILSKQYLVPILKVLDATGNEFGTQGLAVMKNGGTRILNNMSVLGKLFNVKTKMWHSGIADVMQLIGILSAMLEHLKDNKDLLKGKEFKHIFKG